MKKNYYLAICFIFLSLTITAQSWQWGKRGGSNTSMSDASNWTERVRSMATDANGNVFILAVVGTTSLDIDGNEKTGYSNGGGSDYMIASFTCDGTYRWSKVIGGPGSDVLLRIKLDAEGNVYTVGKVIRAAANQTAVHFDTDFTLPPYVGANDNQKSVFLVKYDNDGNFIWLRMPQPDNIGIADSLTNTQIVDFDIDEDGNSFWCLKIPAGSYADNAFVFNGTSPTHHIFKYDADGNFIEATPMDMQVVTQVLGLKMVRNGQTGNYYFAGYISYDFGGNISFGGQQVTHDMFLAAFDATGQFLWLKESSQNMSLSNGFKDLVLDINGDIYLTGGTANGMGFGTYTFASPNPHTFPFILKLNANGDVIWGTNANTAAVGDATAIVKGAVTGGFALMSWNGIDLAVAPNSGYDVYMARFNPDTGIVTNIDTLLDDDGFSDYGSAIAKDGLGNFYVGGRFAHFLYVNSPNPLINSGPQTDFFVAKFGTDNCELDIDKNVKTGMNVYPNPVQSMLTLQNISGQFTYTIHDILGQVVKSANAQQDNHINFEGFSKGLYLLSVTDESGNKETFKIMKE